MQPSPIAYDGHLKHLHEKPAAVIFILKSGSNISGIQGVSSNPLQRLVLQSLRQQDILTMTQAML
jgi:hypothetical protein